MADVPGSAADLGTVAHALLEVALRLNFQSDELDRFLGKPMLRTIEGRRSDHILVDEDMVKAVSYALDYVRSYLATHPKADYEAECLLDASSFVGYESGGTSDVIIHDLPREIAVVDYKNGVQHVDHNDNEQLQIYGLGAIDKFSSRITPRTKIRLVIVQPNSRGEGGPIRETVYSYQDLLDFAKAAALAAKAAYSRNPPRLAGEHCTYCRAAGNCRTYADRALQAAALDFAVISDDMPLEDAAAVSSTDLQRLLTAAKYLRDWLDSLEAEATRRLLLDSEAVPGYKLVQSAPHRRWDDVDRVTNLVQTYAPTRLDELLPRSPLSPAQMSKRVNDARLLQLLQKRVTHNPIEPRVAPEEDKRVAYSAGDDFKGK